jgi:hypothetical protein
MVRLGFNRFYDLDHTSLWLCPLHLAQCWSMLMLTPDLQRPFPDYVICPHCSEPEVEVWCYDPRAQCHACGQAFVHALPLECEDHCDRVRCETERLSRNSLPSD